MRKVVCRNWSRYLMEALGLAVFMIFAGLFSTLLFHPESPIGRLVKEPAEKYALLGLLMFPVVAWGIVSAPWGKKTGAHINPAVTLAFLRLGKIGRWDALYYIIGQFLGAVLGVGLVRLLLGRYYAGPPIDYGATVPGPDGAWVAFGIEFAMTFALMLLILYTVNDKALQKKAYLMIGGLLAFYLATATPFTGMSLNPARTSGSAIWSGKTEGLWLYFAAPILATMAATELYRFFWRDRLAGPHYPPDEERTKEQEPARSGAAQEVS